MSSDVFVEILKEALQMVILLCLPSFYRSLFVGLIVAVFSSSNIYHEQL